MCSYNRVSCLVYFIILSIMYVQGRKEGKKKGKKKGKMVGVHVPLAQHVKHRKSLSGLRQMLLLLQASLSPNEFSVGLLRVKTKRDIV